MLVADCCADSRDLAAAALRGRAYVVTAVDTEDALRWLRKVRPDAVVASTTLPDGGAAALVARMRIDVEVADAPVIAIGAPGGHDAALVAGCAAFVASPFDPARLAAAVERATG